MQDQYVQRLAFALENGTKREIFLKTSYKDHGEHKYLTTFNYYHLLLTTTNFNATGFINLIVDYAVHSLGNIALKLEKRLLPLHLVTIFTIISRIGGTKIVNVLQF